MTRFINEADLLSHGRVTLRRDALAIATAALAAVDPAEALRRSARVEDATLVVRPGDGSKERRYPLRGRRVFVVGAGKASVGMAAVVDELLGRFIADGAVVAREGQATPLRHIEVLEAAHPVPDERSPPTS